MAGLRGGAGGGPDAAASAETESNAEGLSVAGKGHFAIGTFSFIQRVAGSTGGLRPEVSAMSSTGTTKKGRGSLVLVALAILSLVVSGVVLFGS